jgi:hypothetical protein
MNKITRVSDEVCWWLKDRAERGGISMGEVVDAFLDQDWQLLDVYIEYAFLAGLIPDKNFPPGLENQAITSLRYIKERDLKRQGFK